MEDKIDIIERPDYHDASCEVPEEKETKAGELTEAQFNELLDEMKNPVHAQKRLAVQVKTFLDKRIKSEMVEKGFLSDHTRRWVESYNNILEKIQKALHGDKSVNLNLHQISHSQIATMIRKADDSTPSR